jgi:hypothetical protein
MGKLKEIDTLCSLFELTKTQITAQTEPHQGPLALYHVWGSWQCLETREVLLKFRRRFKKPFMRGSLRESYFEHIKLYIYESDDAIVANTS